MHNNTTGTTVEFRCQPMLPPVVIDRRLIQQAIKDIIDCALDAAGTGGTLLVEARSGEDGPQISVTLARRDYQEQRVTSLLPPNWDTDLRVVACRNILKDHGTQLQVDTRQRGFLRFWFILPHSPNQGQEAAVSHLLTQ